MKTMQTRRNGARHNLFWLISLLGAAALVAACGGGGSTATITGGGTGAVGTEAVFAGPISGFGSVIVNGVKLDDSSATVTLDDDVVGASGDLRLGMVVEIEGRRNDDGVTGKANTIGSRSVVRGPVSTPPTATQLTVLGLTVTAPAGTVFEGVPGLGALAAGDMVEIHGIPNGPDGLIATRIGRVAATDVRLTGAVQAGSLNSTNKTFRLHGTLVNYGAAIIPPTQTLAEGVTVRVKGTLATAFTVIPATINATQVLVRNLDNLKKPGHSLSLEGVVTKFTTATDFEVDGTKVSVASNAKVEGTPALGARIEVHGTVDAAGVLIATKVEVKNDSVQKPEGNELHGPISALLSANSFALRGVTVTFDATTRFDKLTVGDLKVGVNVEVKGKVTGNTVLATRIKLED